MMPLSYSIRSNLSAHLCIDDENFYTFPGPSTAGRCSVANRGARWGVWRRLSHRQYAVPRHERIRRDITKQCANVRRLSRDMERHAVPQARERVACVMERAGSRRSQKR